MSRFSCADIVGFGESAGSETSGVLFHETPVITTGCYGWSGLTVWPGVISDNKILTISYTSNSSLNSQPLSLYDQRAIITITILDNRGHPNHTIIHIDHTTLYFNIRCKIFHTLSTFKDNISNTRWRELNRDKFKQRRSITCCT